MIDENDPLPSGGRIGAEERAQNFATRVCTPPANPGYALRLLVPRTWEPLEMPGADQSVNATRPTPLVGFEDPAYVNAPVMFHVQAIGLPRELTAEHFLIAAANQQKQEILALAAPSDVLADSLVRMKIKGAPYLARQAVLFDGDRAYVASGLAHRSDYGSYAETFGAMVASIAIEEPTGKPHVEERVTRELLGTVAFDAPISWRALEVPEGTETHRALDLFQKEPGGKFTGLARVDLDLEARERSFEDEMVYCAGHLMQHGVTLGEPEEIPVEGGEEAPIRPISMHRVPGTGEDDSPVEAWVGLFRVDGAALRVWMVGPARTKSFRAWAVHQRGYRVIVGSLRRA